MKTAADTAIARMRKRHGLDPCRVFSSQDFLCSLAGASIITPGKCYLYTISACRTCLECLGRVNYNHKLIDAGKHGSVRTPMIDFYTTAKTGAPGIPDSVKHLSRSLHHLRRIPSHYSGYVPPSAAQQAESMLKRLKIAEEKRTAKERAATRKADAAPEVIQQDPVKVVKRKRDPKSPWVAVCVKCKKRRPIKAWGECHECCWTR